jgi:hypothetical protein
MGTAFQSIVRSSIPSSRRTPCTIVADGSVQPRGCVELQADGDNVRSEVKAIPEKRQPR